MARDPGQRLLAWLVHHDPYARIVLSCAHVPEPRVGTHDLSVRAVSLTDFTAGLPLQLLACGARRVEYIPCPEEPHAHLEWARLLPQSIGVFAARRHLRRGVTLGWSSIPSARRAMLGIRDEVPIRIDDDDQDRTLASIALLAEDGFPIDPALLGTGSGIHLGAQACTACRVCVNACPESALTITSTQNSGGDTIATVSHSLRACRGCHLCVRLCPVQALVPGDAVTVTEALADDSEILASLATRRCSRCGTMHPSDEGDTCSLCRYREDHPFGSALPPELLSRLDSLTVARLLKGT